MDLCNCAFSGIVILLVEPIDASSWPRSAGKQFLVLYSSVTVSNNEDPNEVFI